MRILVIGGTGTIGKTIVAHFLSGNEVIVVGRTTAGFKVDIANSKSIKKLFKKTGKVDAIICAAGEAKWAPFDKLTEKDFHIGLRSKLMGQVNLVRIGRKYLKRNGSITLTTGILADDPVYQTASAAMVNGAIHSFVQAVALELKKGIRVNVVSSGVVEDAYAKYESYFPGHPPIPMARMMMGYVRSVNGRGTGEVIRIYS